MIDPSTLSDREIVARTAWGEARNQGVEGMQGVINVIFNRAALHWQGETTARGVCLHRKQFDCWLPGDPNLPKLLAVTDADPQYAEALQLADSAFAGTLADITGGADSYEVEGTGAYWGVGLTPRAKIGDQDFYVTKKIIS